MTGVLLYVRYVCYADLTHDMMADYCRTMLFAKKRKGCLWRLGVGLTSDVTEWGVALSGGGDRGDVQSVVTDESYERSGACPDEEGLDTMSWLDDKV